jgi:FkbM family methyltransferase
MSKLRRRYGRDQRVKILNMGIGDKEDVLEMNIASTPTLSTFDSAEMNDLKKEPVLKNVEWVKKEKIHMNTLNYLISQYGLPDFIKMDIEGYEPKALAALSQPIKKLSFEYHTKFREKAIFCIKRLSQLGEYEFNYCIGENLMLELKEWITPDQIIHIMRSSSSERNYGDIYARLKSS